MDKNVVIDVAQKLSVNNIRYCLFGGWAKEVLRLSEPRSHKDIDFLIFATNFTKLDDFARSYPPFKEIKEKRFAHKRAFLYRGTVCEFILISGSKGNYYTHLWGAYKFLWPNIVTPTKRSFDGNVILVARQEAIDHYQRNYDIVERLRLKHAAPN